MEKTNVTNEPFVVRYNDTPFTLVRLLDHEGNFHQNVDVKEAIQKASNLGMDLVCFNTPEESSLALCKIIDFGKWKYQYEKNKKKVEKKQNHKTKEVCFSPVISSHDITHKVKQIKGFIDDGDNVIIVMQANTNNARQMYNANMKIEEIMKLCAEFSKEVSRKAGDRQITINLAKL